MGCPDKSPLTEDAIMRDSQDRSSNLVSSDMGIIFLLDVDISFINGYYSKVAV